jgi:hypothetical protein
MFSKEPELFVFVFRKTTELEGGFSFPHFPLTKIRAGPKLCQ